MRTTLSIDDDVLIAVKGLAKRNEKTVGEVLSELARQALTTPVSDSSRRYRNGVPLLPPNPIGLPVTMEFVNSLREELDQ
ncbi:MAG: hypothetical protein JWM30_2531 [Burkholderia sp.]|nr:hypothetical protein [Burkholderia sp.]